MKDRKIKYSHISDLPVLTKYKTEWDLSLYYKNENDPKIEEDISETIKSLKNFSKKWRGKLFTSNVALLAKALNEYEGLTGNPNSTRPSRYYHFRSELNASDSGADKALAMIRKRLRPATDEILFFTLELAKISKSEQNRLLKSPELKKYKYFLKLVFLGAQHDLSEAEEKIIRLKSAQSSTLWQQMTDKLISTSEIKWHNKSLPLPEALETIETLKSFDKPKIWSAIIEKVDSFGLVAEHEFNAIISDARTEEDLRKFKKPYSATAIAYQHDEKSIESFVNTVSKEGFPLSKKFYSLKANFHGVKELHYSQKYDSIGITPTISLDESLNICRDVFYKVNPLYGKTFDEMLTRGQIDVFPKRGKSGGAFMSYETGHPIQVMLNFTGTMKSLETIAHEMGHAIHASRSSQNSPFYDGHTILTAETASTLFENLVFDAIYANADQETKVILLHDKITGDIATVQRQIAFFNCELEIHNTIHSQGAMSHKELKDCMYRHLKSYLGDSIKISPEDGASYIYIQHLRYGFYVYTYAFGHLLSSLMAAKYKQDNNYRNEIDIFLSAGQTASAVDIYKQIKIDITKPDIFSEALKAQERDIINFKKLLTSSNKQNT